MSALLAGVLLNVIALIFEISRVVFRQVACCFGGGIAKFAAQLANTDFFSTSFI